MAARVREVIHQYGSIAESLMHAFLSFAPVAAGSDDIESEKGFQLMQSVSDLLALRGDKFIRSEGSIEDAVRFVMRVIRCFQLWGEMNARVPASYAIRLELLKVSLASFIVRSKFGGRLPDLEVYECDYEYTQSGASTSMTSDYVGTRSGTRIRNLEKLTTYTSTLPTQTGKIADTRFSDLLHALVPLVYLASAGKRGWNKPRWTAWIMSILLECASILALPESRRIEKRFRIKKLIMEYLIQKPLYSLVLEPPASLVSRIWSKLPLLRELNYLEYYLHMHRKYYYFSHQ